MNKRNWTVRKAEKLLLAACGTLWFTSCFEDSSGPNDEGVSSSSGTDPGASSSGKDLSSMQTPLSSSSSMSVGPVPVYGVQYSSFDEPIAEYGVPYSEAPSSSEGGSSSAAASSSVGVSSTEGVSSSSQGGTSSSMCEVCPVYGVSQPPMRE